jgi:fructose-1,6-bisphosphatase II
LTAAALRCLGGEILARLVVDSSEHEQRSRAMGISDLRRVYRASDLAPGKNIVFAATGVTAGSLLEGVRCFDHGSRTRSLVLQSEPQRVRFIETIHVPRPGDAGRVALRF